MKMSGGRAVGTRFGERVARSWKTAPGRLIHLDVDPSVVGRKYPADAGLIGDARIGLRALLDRLAGEEFRPVWSAAEIASERENQQQGGEGVFPEILRTLRQALDRDAIVTNDMTRLCYQARRLFPVYAPRSFFSPHCFGTLGFAVPAAVGAKIARPERQVVALCGDGGFMFTAPELATARQQRLPLPIVLCNDSSYSALRRMQDRDFGGRHIGVDLENPNFPLFAQSFGIGGVQVTSGAALREALETALRADLTHPDRDMPASIHPLVQDDGPTPRCRKEPKVRPDNATVSNPWEEKMKTYLEACTVPTVAIGEVEIPRLIMGIHPFDGYGYVSPERDRAMLEHFSEFQRIVDVLSYVAGEGITVVQTDHMEPHLHRQHLVAIWKTMSQTGIEIGTVPFLVVPVALDGKPVDQKRVHATFDKNAYERYGEEYREYFKTDPIVAYVSGGHGAEEDMLVQFEQVPPYAQEEIDRMEIDYRTFEGYIGFFDGFDKLIADPGAEIDLLAPGGRFDLIEEYIAYLRKHFRAVVTSVHHPGITIPALEEGGASFDGYITPLNKPGMFMLPTPQSALEAVRNSTRPVIAIKPMAGGRLVKQEAFDYVLNEIGAAACMFGLGRMDEVQHTVSEAKKALGGG